LDVGIKKKENAIGGSDSSEYCTPLRQRQSKRGKEAGESMFI